MTEDVWLRHEIESPCIKVCLVHPATGLCMGCHRTPDEIAAWSRLDTTERREIMATLPARAEAAKPVRRGGRKRTQD